MSREAFEKLVAEEFEKAIPEQFRLHIKNVAFLVEDEPSRELRTQEHLREGETLLGFYHGIPMSERGDFYGVGGALPDTITLFQNPIESEAKDVYESQQATQEGKTRPSGSERTLLRPAGEYADFVRQVIRETIWHEVAHYFGMDERQVEKRETDRDMVE